MDLGARAGTVAPALVASRQQVDALEPVDSLTAVKAGAQTVAPMPRHTIIYLHADAPRKPPEGASCNGCGVCCATAPCPLGMLLSRKRRGACRALRWSEGGARYTCGAVDAPQAWLPWLPKRLVRRLALRWIAAARGCDSDLLPG